MQKLPEPGIQLPRLPAVLLCAAFIVSIVVPAVLHLSGLATDTRYLDNREPKPLPARPASLQDIADFPVALTSYLNDRVGLRAEMVKANVWLYHRIGVSKVPTLVVGKDRWVFLDLNSSFDQFRGLNRFSDAELDRWIDIMEQLQRWTELRGAKFVLVVAPNQQTIYSDYMPSYVTRVNRETRLDQVVRRLRERQSSLNFVDPRADLFAARKHVQLYYRYENHWNTVGGFVAYRTIMRAAEALVPRLHPLTESDIDVGVRRKTWQIPPTSETEPYVRLRGPSRVIGTDEIATVAGPPITKARTTLSDAPGILVYGDSFADQGLVPLIRERSSKTLFVQTAHVPFPYDLIERERPDLVIFEMVERFLSGHLPDQPRAISDVLLSAAPTIEEAEQSKRSPNGGYVEAIVDDDDQFLEVAGWAMDPTDATPARAIFAYQDGRVVGVGWPTMSRPDLAAGAANDAVAFRFSMPRNQVKAERLNFVSLSQSGKVWPIPLAPALNEWFRTAILKEAPSFEEAERNKNSQSGGVIEGFEDNGSGTLQCAGWAIDPVDKRPPRAIFVYQDGRVVGVGWPTVRRPDMAAGASNDVVAFRLTVPGSANETKLLSFYSSSQSGQIRPLRLSPSLLEEQLRSTLLAEAPSFEEAERSKDAQSGGVIEGFEDNGSGTLQWAGWAIDPVDKTPPRAIFVYQSGRVVGVGWPTVSRPDIAPGASNDVVAFRLTVPVSANETKLLSFYSSSQSGQIRPLRLSPSLLEEQLRSTLLAEAPSFEEAERNKDAQNGGIIEGFDNNGSGTLQFAGWAIDPVDRTPPRAILVYQNGRVIGAGWPTIRRPDIADGASNDVVAFRLAIPLSVARAEPLSFFSLGQSGTIRPMTLIPGAAAALDALKR